MRVTATVRSADAVWEADTVASDLTVSLVQRLSAGVGIPEPGASTLRHERAGIVAWVDGRSEAWTALREPGRRSGPIVPTRRLTVAHLAN